MKKSFIRIQILVSLAIILTIQINPVAATTQVYPVDTPTTTYDPGYHYSELTIDVVPKYIQIEQGVEVTWTVKIRVDITDAGDDKTDYIWIRIWLKSTTSGTPDWDTNLLTSPTINKPSGSASTGPSHDAGQWYYLEVTRTEKFDDDEYVEIEFWVKTPDTLSPVDSPHTLVKTFHRTKGDFPGQESTSDYDIWVIFNVGPEFYVPEIPLGTISAIVASLAALGIITKSKRSPLPSV